MLFLVYTAGISSRHARVPFLQSARPNTASRSSTAAGLRTPLHEASSRLSLVRQRDALEPRSGPPVECGDARERGAPLLTRRIEEDDAYFTMCRRAGRNISIRRTEKHSDAALDGVRSSKWSFDGGPGKKRRPEGSRGARSAEGAGRGWVRSRKFIVRLHRAQSFASAAGRSAREGIGMAAAARRERSQRSHSWH